MDEGEFERVEVVWCVGVGGEGGGGGGVVVEGGFVVGVGGGCIVEVIVVVVEGGRWGDIFVFGGDGVVGVEVVVEEDK